MQDLGLSSDEFWMMTLRELKMRLKGQRLRFRVECRMHAVVAQYVAAYSLSKGRAPSIQAIVDQVFGKEREVETDEE